MYRIDEHLATSAESANYTVAIRSALAIGKRTLNKYYNKTDQSEIYRIAMGKYLLFIYLNLHFLIFLTVLHPRHKLQYFRVAGWEDEWIDAAHTIVREEFDRTYAFMDVDCEIRVKKVNIHCFNLKYKLTPLLV
jgi:hypothetical protein